jgi:hypothetical protein
MSNYTRVGNRIAHGILTYRLGLPLEYDGIFFKIGILKILLQSKAITGENLKFV